MIFLMFIFSLKWNMEMEMYGISVVTAGMICGIALKFINVSRMDLYSGQCAHNMYIKLTTLTQSSNQ